MIWTEDAIKRLIGCPKHIVEPPKRTMREEYMHYRNDMVLSGNQGEKFPVFLRQSKAFA